MDPIAFQGLNPSGAEGQFGYTIPNLLIEHAMRNTHVPPGFWRGVNNNQNAVFVECFMDEVAKEVGKDPLEFRRAMMANHPKHLGVLNAVAAKIGWGTPSRRPDNSAASPSTWATAATSLPPPKCRSATAAGSRSIVS